jgi:hypothetical protein
VAQGTDPVDPDLRRSPVRARRVYALAPAQGVPADPGVRKARLDLPEASGEGDQQGEGEARQRARRRHQRYAATAIATTLAGMGAVFALRPDNGGAHPSAALQPRAAASGRSIWLSHWPLADANRATPA